MSSSVPPITGSNSPTRPNYELSAESDFAHSLLHLLHPAPPPKPVQIPPRPKATTKRPRLTAQNRSASSDHVKPKKRSRPAKSNARHVTRHSDSNIPIPLSPIDALASVAAQHLPSYHSPQARPYTSHNTMRSPPPPQYYQSTWQAVVPQFGYGNAGPGERPAKRARSEHFPSPQVGSPSHASQPSRPGTSYQNTFRWGGYNVEQSIDNGMRLGGSTKSNLTKVEPPQSPKQREEQRRSDAELLLGFSRAASSAPRDVAPDSNENMAPSQLQRGLPPFPYGSPTQPRNFHEVSTTQTNGDPKAEELFGSAKSQSRPVDESLPTTAPPIFRPSQTQTPPEEETRLEVKAQQVKQEPEQEYGTVPSLPDSTGLGSQYSVQASKIALNDSNGSVHSNIAPIQTGAPDKLDGDHQFDTPQSLAMEVKDTPSPHSYENTNTVMYANSVQATTSAPTAEEVLAALATSVASANDQSSTTANPSSAQTDIDMATMPPIKAPPKPRKKKEETKCAACAWEHNDFPSGEFVEWLQCNGCKQWFHLQCAGYTSKEVRKIDRFHCTKCRAKHGKTTFVRKSSRAHTSVDYAGLNEGVLRTSDETPEHHYIGPIKDGTIKFDPETFPRMRPEELTADFFAGSMSFSEPILIPAAWNPPRYRTSAGPLPVPVTNTDGTELAPNSIEKDAEEVEESPYELELVDDYGQDKLGMVIPKGLTVRRVAELHGADMPLEVIDVKNQEGDHSKKWTVGRWADYYESPGEKAIRNVISLEVSRSPFGRLIRRPQAVRSLDLQDSVWPKHDEKRGYVGFYCLMSVADSYTDFHIDFGGSSVYYHILKGAKTFFFIPPTKSHLKKYEDWCRNRAQASIFLPDSTKECYRVDLSPGDTMIIPSGWIHAVWTPADSLVIGGNFLTRLHYPMQMRIAEIERNCKVGQKFKYPYFQKVFWYAVAQYLEQDPVPDAVRRTLYSGKVFERDEPSWLQLDEFGLNSISRPQNFHARYYPKLELDGLPDLLSFVYRTVMICLDHLEGTSQDTRKAVMRSVPKEAGDPLEAAKSFALWTVWKRGNEHLPLWAHPNGKGLVQTNIDIEATGKHKRLSAAEMKKLEKAAPVTDFELPPLPVVAAPEIAPQATVEPAAEPAVEPVADITPKIEPVDQMEPPPPTENQPIEDAPDALDDSQATLDEDTLDYSGPEYTFVDGHAISTPKTSVLGPRRTACDVCRKRKMRCKHTGEFGHLPLDAGEEGLEPTSSADNSALDMDMPDDADACDMAVNVPAALEAIAPAETDSADMAVANADPIPAAIMTATAVDMEPRRDSIATLDDITDGKRLLDDMIDGKKTRAKACNECRRSKRRCIHDENGNIDPVKKAEPIVPRNTTTVSKKRKSSGAIDETDGQVKRVRSDDQAMEASLLDPALFADTSHDHFVLSANQSADHNHSIHHTAPMLKHDLSRDMERQASSGSQRGPNGAGVIIASHETDQHVDFSGSQRLLSNGVSQSIEGPQGEAQGIIDADTQARVEADDTRSPSSMIAAPTTSVPLARVSSDLRLATTLSNSINGEQPAQALIHAQVSVPESTGELKMFKDEPLDHDPLTDSTPNGLSRENLQTIETAPTQSPAAKSGNKRTSLSPSLMRRRKSLSVKPIGINGLHALTGSEANGNAAISEEIPGMTEEETENLRLAVRIQDEEFGLRRRS